MDSWALHEACLLQIHVLNTFGRFETIARTYSGSTIQIFALYVDFLRIEKFLPLTH